MRIIRVPFLARALDLAELAIAVYGRHEEGSLALPVTSEQRSAVHLERLDDVATPPILCGRCQLIHLSVVMDGRGEKMAVTLLVPDAIGLSIHFEGFDRRITARPILMGLFDLVDVSADADRSGKQMAIFLAADAIILGYSPEIGIERHRTKIPMSQALGRR